MVDRDAELLTIARDLARALCLGQRGFGRQGDRLPDVDAARKHCERLLELLGEPGPYHYDNGELVPALVLAFRSELQKAADDEKAKGCNWGADHYTDRQVREALAWMASKTK